MASTHLATLSPEDLLQRYRTIASDPGHWEKSLSGFDDLENYSAYKALKGAYGRDIEAGEFSTALPYFRGPTGIDNGRAYAAQIAQQQQKTPQALQKKAPGFSGDVNSIFQSLLQRGASQDEVNHFGSMLASGEVDAYTLNQFVSQLPEYTQKQDATSRQNLNQELSGYDQDFFGKAKENVLSRYAKAGIQNSPSLDFALTNLMGDIQKERSQYMSGLAREDYTRGRDVQRQDYGSSMDRMFADRGYDRARNDQYSDALLNRGWNSADYQIQQNDLMRLLQAQGGGRKRSGLGGAVGPLLGAGIGALAAGPGGAMTGAQIGGYFGGAAGNTYDYLNY